MANDAHDHRPRNAGPAITRRTLLKGTGAAAAAVAIGAAAGPLGTAPAASAASGATAEASSSPARPRPAGPLLEADPHAATMRTRGADGDGDLAALLAGAGVTILPIDRAKFLVGARFDLRIEASGVDPADAVITVRVRDGRGRPVRILSGTPERTTSTPTSVEVTWRGLRYPDDGDYVVEAEVESGGATASAEVRHEVVTAWQRGRRAKNVIFFLGDGMGTPVVTAARLMSKGLTQGKYHGRLHIDGMDYRGFVSTSGVDSIATDSANSMSAYMTGHKSSVNAMGVYEANEPDPNLHPRVETMTELLKRSRRMAVGVVTTSEIQDATPAAVWAHTRRRSEYAAIMDQALNPSQQPDVVLGGGRATLLPKSVSGSRRTDERDLRQEFRDQGYTYVDNRAELAAAVAGRPPRKLIGTFTNGNLNVYLDREHRGLYPEQPTLIEMTKAALKVLARRDEGFFLMVEAASIDKMEHPLDGPRTVYDAIEFDQAIGAALAWAEEQGDTLVVVTADHAHSLSIVGTHNRLGAAPLDRDSNGVYGDAGFPTYADADGDGFPDDPNPDVQLFFGWSNHPDHSDDFQHNTEFAQPALLQGGVAVDNPARDPGAQVQVGNLPSNQGNCVHTVDDVAVYASGPGAARFNAFQDNTEIFFGVVEALGLRVPVDRIWDGRSSETVGGATTSAAAAVRTLAGVG